MRIVFGSLFASFVSAIAAAGASEGVTPETAQFVEYPLPTAGAFPASITSGPDGNLWFTESNGSISNIGRITTAGLITEFPTAAVVQPLGIAVGSDSNLWFVERVYPGGIGRMTTAGVGTDFPMTPSCPADPFCRPFDIASGPDGNLWFTERGGNAIGRITTSGVITHFPLPTLNSVPRGITSGPDGNLWFAEFGANQIGRITPTGVITEFLIPTPGVNPQSITSGPDGNLWFTEVSGNQIGRITPAGVITEFPIPTPASDPWGITAGPNGNLWFTEIQANQIARVTTTGIITEFALPTASSFPQGVTVGPDGNLWFTETFGNKIGKLILATAAPPWPVPDGIYGLPIRGTKNSNGNVDTTWDMSHCASIDYNVYWGRLANLSEIAGGRCATGRSGAATDLILPPNSWWLIAGTEAGAVSSFGKDSSGVEESFIGWGAGGICPGEPVQNSSSSCPP